MKTKTILIIVTLLFLTSLMISLSSRDAMAAKEPAERFKGYNKEKGVWTTGNLGKAYVEGDFVSYQLRIDKASKVWGAEEFSISFNFHQDSSKAIYVDGFDVSLATGFQYSIDGAFLPDGQQWPDPPWTHIPTPEADGSSPTAEPRITNYMNAWPPGIGDGTPAGSDPADERYFTVYKLPWTGDHIILFFRAHLALDIVWSIGEEDELPKVLDGDEFDTWTTEPDALRGASFATGSSRHFYLRYENIGKKTIPIPIAQYPSTVINGYKYVDTALFNDWEITLSGELSLYGPWTIPYNPPPVRTGPPPATWTTGYFEFTGLISGTFTVQEEDRYGYVHVNILTSGPFTGKNVAEGWVSFDLAGGQMYTVDFYNLEYQDLTVSKTATPYWRQNITWTIVKTATPELSEIFVGDKTDVKYTITVSATPTADYYEVLGIITINNPNPAEVAVYATISDEVLDGTVVKGFQDLTPTGPILIPSGVSTYPYSIELPDIGVGTYINNVTVTVTSPISETHYWEEPFSFTTPTEYVDEEVDVEDEPWKGYLGTVSYFDPLPKTFEYTRIFGPYSVMGVYTYDNTATATGKDTLTEWTDDASVTIKVYDITVSKTAETYWEQVFEWSIGKSVVAAQLQPFINDQIEVKYTITVKKILDSQTFNVSGTITITNNNPAKDALVYVVDKIYDDMTEVYSLDLGGPYTVEYGTPKTIDYEIFFTPEVLKTYTNVAHINLTNYLWKLAAPKKELPYKTKFTGDDDFTFTTPTKIIDDSATVEEDETVPPEFSHVVWGSTHGDPPWFVTDSTIIVFKKNITEVSATPCTWFDLPNTVTLTESDTLTVYQASALVRIHVVVPYAGTIGYWRNHPEAWQDISPDDPFPWTTDRVAGYTYMQVLQTEPAGDASIQLARQYIGAKLNQIVFGVPSDIADKIAEAESFLAILPAGSNPEGNDRAYAIELADILEDYNSGGISPP